MSAQQTTVNKQANALITLYISLYMRAYGSKPKINRYREKWGFLSMIEDLGYERSKEVVGYYFSTGKIGHPVNYLLSNYDRLDSIMTELAEDEANREKLRKQTEARVKQWEETHGYERSQTD